MLHLDQNHQCELMVLVICIRLSRRGCNQSETIVEIASSVYNESNQVTDATSYNFGQIKPIIVSLICRIIIWSLLIKMLLLVVP